MEYMAKNGDMYYQAVSDEFENYPYNDKLFFEARISLRGFIINTSLPFYREGKNGPGIYRLLNVAMAIGMMVLTTMSGLNFRLQ